MAARQVLNIQSRLQNGRAGAEASDQIGCVPRVHNNPVLTSTRPRRVKITGPDVVIDQVRVFGHSMDDAGLALLKGGQL